MKEKNKNKKMSLILKPDIKTFIISAIHNNFENATNIEITRINRNEYKIMFICDDVKSILSGFNKIRINDLTIPSEHIHIKVFGGSIIDDDSNTSFDDQESLKHVIMTTFGQKRVSFS